MRRERALLAGIALGACAVVALTIVLIPTVIAPMLQRVLDRPSQPRAGKAPSQPFSPKRGLYDPNARDPNEEARFEMLLSQINTVFPEGDWPYDATAIEQWMDELLPLVEQAAGREFARRPTVKLVSRRDVAEVIRKQTLDQLRNNNVLSLTTLEIREAAWQTAAVFAPALLGLYGHDDQVVYLVPSNVRPMIEVAGVEERLVEPIARIVLAHELTHALQDQVVDLKEVLLPRGGEGLLAAMAAIEGHAVYVQDLVGEKLGQGKACLTMARLLAAHGFESGEAATDLLKHFEGSQFEQTYLGGRRFIDYHAGHGGFDQVWKVLAKPPVSMSVIIKPETYGQPPPRIVPYGMALSKVQTLLGPGPWNPEYATLHEQELLQRYSNCTPSERKQIIDSVKAAEFVVFLRPNSTDWFSVALYVVHDAAFAPQLAGFCEQVARDFATGAIRTSTARVGGGDVRDLEGIQAEIAHDLPFRFTPPGGAAMSRRTVVIVRGEVLLELCDLNVGLDDATIIAIAEEIFQKYEKVVSNPDQLY